MSQKLAVLPRTLSVPYGSLEERGPNDRHPDDRCSRCKSKRLSEYAAFWVTNEGPKPVVGCFTHDCSKVYRPRATDAV